MRKYLVYFFQKIRNGDLIIYITVILLILFGSIMVGSATIGNSAASTVSGASGGAQALLTIIKQVAFVSIGIFAMIICAGGYTHWLFKKGSVCLILYIVMIGMLLSCLAFGATNGSYAWWKIPGIGTFQPAEVCKIGMVILLSYMLVLLPEKYAPKSNKYYNQNYRHPKEVRKRAKIRYVIMCILLPFLAIITEFIVVAKIQNDTGTALITFLICAACLFMTERKHYKTLHKIIKYVIMIVLVGVVVLGVLFMVTYFTGFYKYLGELFNIDLTSILQGYQASRFSSWLNPLGDVYNTSAQLFNALLAITKGGIKGVGLFNSTQKYGYIPEVQTDFITSLIFEELGLIGLALIIIPYGIIIFRLLYFGFISEDTRSRIVLVGIASYFFCHLFVNLGGVSGLIPMTGVPLIFISQGGSSILTGGMAIGIAQAIISMDKAKRKKLLENG